MRREKNEPTPCNECQPYIMPENIDVINIYSSVKNQVLLTMGEMVDLNHLAVQMWMELYGITEPKEQRACLNKVSMMFHHILDAKHQQEDR